MPLQNRVDPFGNLFASPARGLFMGNRGGRFHDPEQRTLSPSQRWVTRQWICCRLQFNNRHRRVWGDSYTELFFLDEVTALAAGHRPCFECRRADAEAFASAWQHALRLRAHPRAAEMDAVLHAERVHGHAKRLHRVPIDELPDGACLTLSKAPGQALAVRGRSLLQWTPAGYTSRRRRPRGINVDVITPPAILSALRGGYRPSWHPSVGRQPR